MDYQTLVESIRDAFFVIDKEWRLLYLNHHCQQYFDAPVEGLAGTILWDHLPELSSTGFRDECARAMAEDAVTSYHSVDELDHRTLDFHIYRCADGVSVLVVDLSERHEAERALHESEERYHMVMNSITDYAIITMDTKGNVTDWNDGAEHVLGYSAEEMTGRPLTVIFTPEDVARGVPQEELLMAFYKGCSDDERWHIRKGGTRFFASGVLTPLKDDQGNLRGYAKVLRDITDRQRMEAELREAKVLAEAASDAKGQFLAVLSHELRTPLTPVMAAAQVLMEDPDIDESSRSLLEIVYRNIQIEVQLIDDLLDLTRVASGKLQLNVEAIDLHALLRSVVDICQGDLQAKRQQLTIALDAEHHQVEGDGARLQQVFWNLLKNAVKFTPEEGQIVIRTASHDRRVHVRIEDTGIGIEPEILPRIFHAFEQGGMTITKKFGGLGLGLSITKALVDVHGGKITVESDGENKGATFIVELKTMGREEPG